MNAEERERERQIKSREMIEAAEKRSAEDAEAGVIREPVSAMRVNAEFAMLAARQGLTGRAAHRKLADYLTSQGSSLDEFKRDKDKRKNLEQVREAFTTGCEICGTTTDKHTNELCFK